MSEWIPCGYVPPGTFEGAIWCRFRISHRRSDGQVWISTLGHQTDQRGRVVPVTQDFYFCTFVVGLVSEDPRTGRAETVQLERAAAPDFATAEAQHLALLARWATRDPVPPEKTAFAPAEGGPSS